MIHLDFETFCDLDVREVGAEAYARHPSCEVLMMSYAIDQGPVQLWLPDGPWDYDSFPLRLNAAVCAHNVAFEWNILHHVLGITLPFEQLRDTSALALVYGYPKSLEGVGSALRLPIQKDKRGKTLIRKFCVPRKPTKNRPGTRNWPHEFPDEWEEFKGYCRTDTEVERMVWDALASE